MSLKKSPINKKAAAGAALVALSGFVPQPLAPTARAATATISVTGSLVTGITLTKVQDLQFGSFAATAKTGKLALSTAGAVAAPSKAVAVGGTLKAGIIKFEAVSTAPKIDITITGLGPVTLGATAGGAAAVGTVKLNNVVLNKIGAASVKLTAVGTSAKKTGVAITKTSAQMLIGMTAAFSGGAPIVLGSWTEALVFTISY